MQNQSRVVVVPLHRLFDQNDRSSVGVGYCCDGIQHLVIFLVFFSFCVCIVCVVMMARNGDVGGVDDCSFAYG